VDVPLYGAAGRGRRRGLASRVVQYYTVAPEKFVRKIVSLDPAFKTASRTISRSCKLGEDGNDFYLLACWRGRVEYPKLKTMLIAFAEQWRPDAV